MSPVENLTDLPAEIEAVKHELAERRAHLDKAEGKLGEAMAAGDFQEASTLDLFIRKEQLATECALLESRVGALEARLVADQERATREQKRDEANKLTGTSRSGSARARSSSSTPCLIAARYRAVRGRSTNRGGRRRGSTKSRGQRFDLFFGDGAASRRRSSADPPRARSSRSSRRSPSAGLVALWSDGVE